MIQNLHKEHLSNNHCIVENLVENIDIFYTGLKNGKLIEWHVMPLLNDGKKIIIK